MASFRNVGKLRRKLRVDGESVAVEPGASVEVTNDREVEMATGKPWLAAADSDAPKKAPAKKKAAPKKSGGTVTSAKLPASAKSRTKRSAKKK